MEADTQGKKAIIFGASGFVGNYILEGLLNDPDYDQVIVVVRKNLNLSHPKLVTLIGDYHSLPSLKDQIVADEVFISLGTTKKNTPDQKIYYEVDHDYPVLATQIAKEKGAKSVFLVSAVGPDAGSSIFYVRTKGETERDVVARDLLHTHIFRPSMIMGDRQESRPMGKNIHQIILPAQPPPYRPCPEIQRNQSKRHSQSNAISRQKACGKGEGLRMERDE